MSRLKIGYVPEHFSTPLAFAHKHYNLDADLEPVPLGTGHLASRLKADAASEEKIDVAIGLTEGFVADLGKSLAVGDKPGYGLLGTYVESPLRWAISTGAKRDELRSVQNLKGKKVGVSRIGSGSYVMSYVLADQQGWLDPTSSSGSKEPFDVKVIGNFKQLRDSVNSNSSSAEADFFMWEHFTTKHFWDNGELKRIGEIYTPWPSWMITARQDADERALQDMLGKINKGIQHYKDNAEEAVDYISSTMDYSKEDAREWMKSVRFPDDVRGVRKEAVENTIKVLQKAGVLDEQVGTAEDMIVMQR